MHVPRAAARAPRTPQDSLHTHSQHTISWAEQVSIPSFQPLPPYLPPYLPPTFHLYPATPAWFPRRSRTLPHHLPQSHTPCDLPFPMYHNWMPHVPYLPPCALLAPISPCAPLAPMYHRMHYVPCLHPCTTASVTHEARQGMCRGTPPLIISPVTASTATRHFMPLASTPQPLSVLCVVGSALGLL